MASGGAAAIGEALLVAVDAGINSAESTARGWVVAPRDRGWAGDAARLGDGPPPTLRAVPVNREGDPTGGGGRVDLRTGQVWPDPVCDDALALAIDGDG